MSLAKGTEEQKPNRFALGEKDQEKLHLRILTKILMIPEVWYLILGIWLN